MIPFSTQLYRVLLLAYPAPFRHEYAGQMAALFRERCIDETSAAGLPGLFILWLQVLFDTAISAPREHYFMLINDIKFAARSLRKSAGFTTAAVVCLGLGIGASTAIFSIVNAVLLKPLPYRNSERYARVYTMFKDEGFQKFWFSPPEFKEIQQHGRVWDRIEAWAMNGSSLQGGARPLRINTCYLSGGMMPMLGVAPQIGRVIIPANDEAGVETALVLFERPSREKRAFGSDPGVIGRETQLDGSKAVIVGVMPAGFDFPPGAAEPADAWAPLQITSQQLTQTGSHFLSLIALLKPGISVDTARGDLLRIVNEMGTRASPYVPHN